MLHPAADASFLFWIGRKQCPYPAFLVTAGMETGTLCGRTLSDVFDIRISPQ